MFNRGFEKVAAVYTLLEHKRDGKIIGYATIKTDGTRHKGKKLSDLSNDQLSKLVRTNTVSYTDLTKINK